MEKTIFNIDQNSDIPKFRQLVNNVNTAIAQNELQYGDILPSVNQLCEETKLSRDTVFKSYQILKAQGIIDSVPNKGYYVAKEVRRIFLLLDTFKAYKEVLYNTFINALPENYSVDVQFHHYNPAVFEKLVQDNIGQYSSYVVMPFDSEVVKNSLSQIPTDNLLVIDWNVFENASANAIYQDFGTAFSKNLEIALPQLKKYSNLTLVYPKYTNHPKTIVSHFNKFCKKHDFNATIETGANDFEVKKDTALVSVSERSLGYILSQCKSNQLQIGKDVGIISYNETPMKEFIAEGISVISTDFELMGKKAAEFVLNSEKTQLTIPTTFINRSSI